MVLLSFKKCFDLNKSAIISYKHHKLMKYTACTAVAHGTFLSQLTLELLQWILNFPGTISILFPTVYLQLKKSVRARPMKWKPMPSLGFAFYSYVLPTPNSCIQKSKPRLELNFLASGGLEPALCKGIGTKCPGTLVRLAITASLPMGYS